MPVLGVAITNAHKPPVLTRRIDVRSVYGKDIKAHDIPSLGRNRDRIFQYVLVRRQVRGTRFAILTAFLQGIDMFRIHHDTVKLIRMQPPHIQEEQMATFKKGMPVKFPQHYIAKVIGYGLVTLVAASITRSIMG